PAITAMHAATSAQATASFFMELPLGSCPVTSPRDRQGSVVLLGHSAYSSGARDLPLADDCVDDLPCAEAHGVVGGQSGLVLGGRDRRARALVVEPARVERDRDNRRWTGGQRHPLV